MLLLEKEEHCLEEIGISAPHLNQCFGKVLKHFFLNLMPNGAEFKYTPLNENLDLFHQSSLMKGKVHI